MGKIIEVFMGSGKLIFTQELTEEEFEKCFTEEFRTWLAVNPDIPKDGVIKITITPKGEKGIICQSKMGVKVSNLETQPMATTTIVNIHSQIE